VERAQPEPHRLLLRNARIATCAGEDATDQGRLDVQEHAALLVEGRSIAWIGRDADAPRAGVRPSSGAPHESSARSSMRSFFTAARWTGVMPW
jgi:hypothetical protein